MKNILLLFLFFTSFSLFAQINSDSLLRINNELSSEKEQLLFLNEQCQQLNKNLDKGGDVLFEQRQQLSEKIDDFNQQAEYANSAFDYFRNTYNITKSDSILRPYLDQIEKITDSKLQGLTLYSGAIMYENERENEQALVYANKALIKYEEAGLERSKEYAAIKNFIGKFLTNINRFGESNIYLNEAQAIYLTNNDSLGLMGLYTDFAILFSQIGLFDKATDYLEKRRKYMSTVNDIDKAYDWVNVGRNLIIQERYEDALNNYHKTLGLSAFPPEFEFINMYTYNGIIECLYFTNQRDSIPYYFTKLDAEFEKLNRQKTFEFLYLQSNFLYLLHEEKYAKAEQIGLKLYNNSVKTNDGAEIEMHALFLSELYRQQKDYKNALKYTDIYTTKRDSTKEFNKISALLLYQTQYETKEKENAILKLESEKKIEQTKSKFFSIAAFVMLSILLIILYLFRQIQKARTKLEKSNIQLQDLNATKDKFFGIIAHDIRSPITALDGVSEQMTYYLEKNDTNKLNRLADRIDTTAKRLTSLLDNLLNWALLQTGMIPYNPKSVNIQSVAQENINLFLPVAEAKNIILNNEISAASPVFSDENALQTIIRNLLNNAIKFTPQGGEVSISTEEKGNKIFIKINDTGTGIAADKLEKLFSLEKKSSKGTAGEKGSGLGLMLCKELVELNKGTIQAISELGKGSSFVFSLPRT